METGLTWEILCRYHNAEVQTESYKCVIVGITKTELVLSAKGGSITDNFIHPISECQLILSKLDSITDEDALQCAEILDYQVSNTDENAHFDIPGFKDHLNELTVCYGSSFQFKMAKQLIDYLRIHNYNVDGLIEKGIAILKTK